MIFSNKYAFKTNIFVVLQFAKLNQIFLPVSDLFSFSGPFKLIESRGKGMMEDKNGYRFTFKRHKKNGIKTWSCTRIRSKNCRTSVDTKGDFIIYQNRPHTHDP
jgi:hypothetical protein